jgi:hypothetical protein
VNAALERIAGARLAETDARARERDARRAEWSLLGDRFRDEADGLRVLVVRLERSHAAGVKAWVGAACGRRGYG